MLFQQQKKPEHESYHIFNQLVFSESRTNRLNRLNTGNLI